MVANILAKQEIHRIDVNFNVKTKNLDSFIGRTAHINLIIQESLFKIIVNTMPNLFDVSYFWMQIVSMIFTMIFYIDIYQYFFDFSDFIKYL